MLYVHYIEYNPLENEYTDQRFSQLDAYLRSLPLKQADPVIYLVADICWELQRQAFISGIQVGIRLSGELSLT